MKTLRYSLFLLFVAVVSVADAQQTDRDFIRQGNRYFHMGEMDKAVTSYQKALEKKRTVEVFYNLGCANAVMNQDSTSLVAFMNADTLGFTNPLKRAMNFHNMGNLWYKYGLSRMHSNDGKSSSYFLNAVNLYKSALRCNPNDNETRYNLAMAQWMLKKSQNGNGGDNNNQQNKDDKNKDKQKQDKQKQQEQQQQKQQQQQQQQQEKDQMSDQAAEQLLNSAQQDEKAVQRKVKAQPAKRRSLNKDW